MKLRNRILLGVAAVVTLGLVSVAIALSYDAPCGEEQPIPSGVTTMKAVVLRCYGSADVVKLAEVARPAPAQDQVLVRVHAAAINPLEWHQTTGTPYIMRLSSGLGAPKHERLGVDFAGVVESVGTGVTRFKIGDEVFGAASGAFAEYLVVREGGALVHKPPNLTFAEAASIPVAGVTALQGLRDNGQVRPGQKVLINGASGGVGTFAVQIAKASGAEVTGVCSTRNVQLVKSIGADHVIDYTQENFTERAQQYDLILDTVGNHSLRDTIRALKPSGALVIVSGPKRDRWLGPVLRWGHASLLSRFVDEQLVTFIADIDRGNLEVLSELAASGKLRPVVDRHYTLAELPDALRYIETRRARGKVVIDVYAADSSEPRFSRSD